MPGKEKRIKTKSAEKAGKLKITKKKSKNLSAGCGDGEYKKEYLKSKALCKVTFRLPKEAVKGAENATIVGDFNNWDVTESPMKRLKNGDFTLTLELPCDREYNFRYLVDTKRWDNEWFADKNVPNNPDEENLVIST